MSKITVADVIKALQFGYEQKVNTTLTPKDAEKLIDEISRLRMGEALANNATAKTQALLGADIEIERLRAKLSEAENLLTAANHALRSYQYGNGAPDLAKEMADKIDARKAQP